MRSGEIDLFAPVGFESCDFVAELVVACFLVSEGLSKHGG